MARGAQGANFSAVQRRKIISRALQPIENQDCRVRESALKPTGSSNGELLYAPGWIKNGARSFIGSAIPDSPQRIRRDYLLFCYNLPTIVFRPNVKIDLVLYGGAQPVIIVEAGDK